MPSPGAISAGLLKRIQNQLGGSADHVVFAFARNQVIPQIDRPLLSYLGNRHALADAIVYDSSIRPIVRREVMTIGRTENFTNPTVAKRTYTVAEVMDILGVSRKKAYELCNSGSFKIVHIGRSIRVSKASFDAWLDNQSSQMEE